MKTLILITGILLSPFAFAHEGHNHPPTMSHLVFAKGELHAHATWQVGPRESEESILRIEWKNGANHQPTEPNGQFKVQLWMPDMGHGSAPTQVQRVLGQQGNPMVGVYDVYNVYFIMGGHWQVNVTLTYANGSQETKTIELDVAGSGHIH